MLFSELSKDYRDSLKNVGILEAEDALFQIPSKYQDYTIFFSEFPRNNSFPTSRSNYKLQVIGLPKKYYKPGQPTRLSLFVTDGNFEAEITVFGEVWMWEKLSIDEIIYIEGILDIWDGRLQIKGASLVKIEFIGKIVPLYKSKRVKTSFKAPSVDLVRFCVGEGMRIHLNESIDQLLSQFAGLTESELLSKFGNIYQSLRSFFVDLHTPSTIESAIFAQNFAVKLASFHVVYSAHIKSRKVSNLLSSINIDEDVVYRLISKFPHKLTIDQMSGIFEIAGDLKNPYPMNRLLSGDVGYGKTEVALIPSIAANLSGSRVAILCPSILIVEQWAQKIREYGMCGVKLVSSKHKLKPDDLADNPILVGTSALVTSLPRLGIICDLVILDEQQKQGKNTKNSLISSHTNRLEVTATCIPQTSALVYYGGMDETILNICPVEKKVSSTIVLNEQKYELFDHLKKIREKIPRAQIAIVYPNVNADDPKTGLIASFSKWDKLFPGEVGILHGKLSDTQKLDITNKMRSGDIKILLSSILIETGITLPSLRAMVVIKADRFGVSALHQLRGRLARHGGYGFFCMMPDPDASDESMDRLNLVANHNDGFVLADLDAQIRGYGNLDIDDKMQHGLTNSEIFHGIKITPQSIKSCVSF